MIRTQNLAKTYRGKRGDIVAVESLDLTVRRGEIFGLLGPNGAGKTTTIRMLCGLLRPSGGAAWIDGLPVADQPMDVRKRIGLVPEDAGDHKNLTLAEELTYYGALYGLSAGEVRRRSMPLIDRLRLRDRVNDRLGRFSRGMRRKFHLIRALLHQPAVLLLDEPTAGLDPDVCEEVWELFKSLAEEHHVTVIICSHHLEEVERLCERVAIIQRKLLVEGSLADLNSSNGEYRIELGDDSMRWRDLVGSMEGVQSAEAERSVLDLRLQSPAEQFIPHIVRKLAEADAPVIQVIRRTRDLRALYRATVRQEEDEANGSPQQ
jgi:ABC-2 type transport system ATP-binding protein